MNKLKEQLKVFMAEHDLTIEEVAKRIGRNPRTIWQFLNDKVDPHFQTKYRIKKLIQDGDKNNPLNAL